MLKNIGTWDQYLQDQILQKISKKPIGLQVYIMFLLSQYFFM